MAVLPCPVQCRGHSGLQNTALLPRCWAAGLPHLLADITREGIEVWQRIDQVVAPPPSCLLRLRYMHQRQGLRPLGGHGATAMGGRVAKLGSPWVAVLLALLYFQTTTQGLT